MTMLSVVC